MYRPNKRCSCSRVDLARLQSVHPCRSVQSEAVCEGQRETDQGRGCCWSYEREGEPSRTWPTANSCDVTGLGPGICNGMLGGRRDLRKTGPAYDYWQSHPLCLSQAPRDKDLLFKRRGAQIGKFQGSFLNWDWKIRAMV